MRRLGLDPELPPQGFYNAGQKLVAVIAVLCSLGLALTGLILVFVSGRPERRNCCASACSCISAVPV